MKQLRLLATLACAAVIASCAGKDDSQDKKNDPSNRELADYRSAGNQESNRLLRPPRVISDAPGDLLLVEGTAGKILPTISDARVVREGSAIWLEVDLPISMVWPIVRRFWLDEGFGIDVEFPEAGIIETDWQQNRAKILGTGISEWFDIALERLHDTGERHRFRTRLERAGPDATLIFIAFRGVIEKSANKFEPQPNDPTLEAEMLSRLLLSFRADEELLASVTDPTERSLAERALYQLEGNELVIKLPFEDAWRRVAIALDRAGFTVSSRNKQSGVIEILYAEPERDPENIGLLERLSGKAGEAGAPFPVSIRFGCASSACRVSISGDAKYQASIIQVLLDNL